MCVRGRAIDVAREPSQWVGNPVLFIQQISGQLFLHKLVEGHVFVQGIDHIVTIQVGFANRQI